MFVSQEDNTFEAGHTLQFPPTAQGREPRLLAPSSASFVQGVRQHRPLEDSSGERTLHKAKRVPRAQ